MEKLENTVEVSGNFKELPIVQFKGQSPVGLEKAVIIEGNGEEIKKGDNIEVHYHGLIFGTEKVFDSSFKRGETIEFPIGVGSLIKAWDTTIPGNKVGSRLIISADPEFAYGSQTGAMFGSDSANLFFVVDLIAIK